MFYYKCCTTMQIIWSTPGAVNSEWELYGHIIIYSYCAVSMYKNENDLNAKFNHNIYYVSYTVATRYWQNNIIIKSLL